MAVEIEAKIKVDSLDSVAERLESLGAEFIGERIQRDYYFEDADGTMAKNDKALRVRRESDAKGEKVVLTYKGPREDGQFKVRPEFEVGADDDKVAVDFFEAMGYRKTLAFEKKRRIWNLGECEVALDELCLLGCFVEIEGPDEKAVGEVQGKLNLSDLEHISDSYALLMNKKLAKDGIEKTEIFFD